MSPSFVWMDNDLEEHVYSILRGRHDSSQWYPCISEFKRDLRGGAPLAEEKLRWRWVLWNSNYTTQPLQKTITDILKHISAEILFDVYVVQFWAVFQVEGRYHYLSASDHPFFISQTTKGRCCYRNLCVDRVYRVDMEEGTEEEPIGGVGRAYRNKRPESTPDLRLYSINEFPLRDEAARWGFRAYSAFPLFDQTQCYGVLEFLSRDTTIKNIIPRLNQGLQIAGLRSTHTNFIPFSDFGPTVKMPDKYKQQPEGEITSILELCIKLVPGPSLAQVWIPCKQCVNITTAFFCMERTSFITAQAYQRIPWRTMPGGQGCPIVLQFALKAILEMRLERFRLLAREQFPVELDFQSRQSDGIVLDVMNSFKENFSEWNFIEYMETVDLCCMRPSAINYRGWVFRLPNEDKSPEKDSNSLSVQMKKVLQFMKKIEDNFWRGYWMVQFWAPKMVGDNCYLETSTQPYALGCLAKGLASFRKKCLKHHYFVDEEAKDEELGPPGRVFRNCHPEINPNILLYSTKEFPLRNYAVHCCLGQYFALPVFSGNNHKCVGVLELIGFNYLDLKRFGRPLEAAEFCSTHIDFRPMYLRDGAANLEDQQSSVHVETMASIGGPVTNSKRKINLSLKQKVLQIFRAVTTFKYQVVTAQKIWTHLSNRMCHIQTWKALNMLLIKRWRM